MVVYAVATCPVLCVEYDWWHSTTESSLETAILTSCIQLPTVWRLLFQLDDVLVLT